MTLEQLKILSQIVKHGSLKAAAMAMHKTQPALSIAIKKLEQEFGFQILDRNQYRLTLTAQGKTFYREAEILLNDVNHLKSLGQQLALGNEAKFSICYEQVCPENLVIPAIKNTYRQFPATEFSLKGGARFMALQGVKNEEIDIGIGPWFHLFHAQGNFDSFCIGHFDLILVASPKLLKNNAIVSYEQLLRLPSISMPESGLTFDNDKLAYNHGSMQFKAEDALSLKHLVVAGVGWAFVPLHLIDEELATGSLQIIDIEDNENCFSGEIRVIRNEKHNYGPVNQFMWQEFKKIEVKNGN